MPLRSIWRPTNKILNLPWTGCGEGRCGETSPLEGVADAVAEARGRLPPSLVSRLSSLVSKVVPYGLHSTSTLRRALILLAVKLELANTACAWPMANFRSGFTHFFLRMSRSSAPWKFSTSGILNSLAAPRAM